MEIIIGVVLLILFFNWLGAKVEKSKQRKTNPNWRKASPNPNGKGSGIKTRVIELPKVKRSPGDRPYWVDIADGSVYQAFSDPNPNRTFGPFASETVALKIKHWVEDLGLGDIVELYHRLLTGQMEPKEAIKVLDPRVGLGLVKGVFSYTRSQELDGRGDAAKLHLIQMLFFVRLLGKWVNACLERIDGDYVLRSTWYITLPDSDDYLTMEGGTLKYHSRRSGAWTVLPEDWFVGPERLAVCLEKAKTEAETFFARTA